MKTSSRKIDKIHCSCCETLTTFCTDCRVKTKRMKKFKTIIALSLSLAPSLSGFIRMFYALTERFSDYVWFRGVEI